MDRNTSPPHAWRCEVAEEVAQIPVVELDPLQMVELLAAYGVGDMIGVAGAEDRVVTLSERSDVVCPMHERRLVPDACRSCSFLAGEAA